MGLILLILFVSISTLGYGQDSVSLRPLHSFHLHEDLKESSGLIYWDGDLWTHNDSKDNTLYRLDPAKGEITERILLKGLVNTDWEDMAQDKDYIYIGDIGNNSGSRRDLHILRISKLSLNKNAPEIDIISYSYAGQDNFTSRPNATDFDCEAMIVLRGQIFLFTKEWISAGTSVYTMPARPGFHKARKVSNYPVVGLITGADISADGNTVILSGYNSLIQPFLYLLTDPSGEGFESEDLFRGSHQKIPLILPSHQVEGIAIKNAKEIFISNEYLRVGSWIEVRQQLHSMQIADFTDF